MDIHEYQSKEILADYGVSICKGGLAYSPEQAAYRAIEIGGECWIVKAQIHSCGRGRQVVLKFVNQKWKFQKLPKNCLVQN
jgi:malate-CoA ligase subunit beta